MFPKKESMYAYIYQYTSYGAWTTWQRLTGQKDLASDEVILYSCIIMCFVKPPLTAPTSC